MDGQKRSVVVMRSMLMCLCLAYSSALYFELSPPKLSAEALQYRHVVWLSNSGFSLSYALQKFGWAIGTGIGAFGVVLMFLRRRHGLPFLAASAPTLVTAVLLGASTSAYPDTETAIAILLWFITGASWGAVMTYALVQRELFVDRRAHSQPQARRDEAQHGV